MLLYCAIFLTYICYLIYLSSRKIFFLRSKQFFLESTFLSGIINLLRKSQYYKNIFFKSVRYGYEPLFFNQIIVPIHTYIFVFLDTNSKWVKNHLSEVIIVARCTNYLVLIPFLFLLLHPRFLIPRARGNAISQICFVPTRRHGGET